MIRIWLTAFMAAGVWLLSVYGQSRPVPLGLDAPATAFSAARADAVLGRLLGSQAPHPVGSAAGAAAEARLLQELSAMGVPAHVQAAMSCFSEPHWGVIECGTVRNVIADVAAGASPQVLLMAHRDSVAAGPGACDDGCGAAALLETIRALKARGGRGHPVTALFTDGEEAGMLGAAAWLRAPHPPVGAVINVEARGDSGASYLFQTSPGDAKLIDLYAASVPHFATSSLYGEIYKVLPNDTDLTPFLQAGFTGYNFAMIGGVARYHTAQDRRENIEPASLQQEGDNALGLATSLRRADFAALKSGNAIYLDVLGRWLPRLPVSWALPLAVVAFVLIAWSGMRVPRHRRDQRRPVIAGLMPPLLLAGCIGVGFVLHLLAAGISGHSDPSYATPVYLRWSLAFGVWAVALVAARGAGAVACWLWIAALAIACAIVAPGLSPHFLFPSLVAAPLLLLTPRRGRGVALCIAALAGLVIWMGLTAGLEPVMGLKMHPLFTVTAGFGLVMALPLLAPVRGLAWAVSLMVSVIAALGLAVVAGFQPATSATAPMRLNIEYLEQDGKAWWLADTGWDGAWAKLPDRLRAAAPFSASPMRLAVPGYAAAASPAHFPAPGAAMTRSGDVVTLDLKAAGEGVVLEVPRDAGLQSFTIGGITRLPPPGESVYVICATPDCAHARMTLRLTSRARVKMMLADLRAGLPAGGARFQALRSADETPSQGGDRTILATTIIVPGG